MASTDFDSGKAATNCSKSRRNHASAERLRRVGKTYGSSARPDNRPFIPARQPFRMTQTTPMPETAAPPERFPMTRTARLARARLSRRLEGFGDDAALWRKVQERVPAAWATLEEDIDTEEPKVKITLRLDASVAQVFRAMGKGYQNRMNHVLATYAQMQIGEVRRIRRKEEDIDALIQNQITPEMAAFYRDYRHLVAGNDEIDLEVLDRLFGLE